VTLILYRYKSHAPGITLSGMLTSPSRPGPTGSDKSSPAKLCKISAWITHWGLIDYHLVEEGSE